jgi:alpha-L-fucosidase
MKERLTIVCILILFGCVNLPQFIYAQVNTDGTIDTGDQFANAKLESNEAPEIISKRLEWWSEARFGMFIHWGLYAQNGCFYKGKDGRSEHMMRNLKIPIKEYEQIAHEFNPVKFDAEEWVQVAQSAGMKYIVLTSKHHDGFAMFNSPSNEYNIIKQTSWKKDPIKELTEACEKYGMKFGVYYSLGRDWHHPNCNSVDGWRSNVWDFPEEEKKDFSIYFNEKVKPQITELISQYHPAIIWFDTPELITKAQSIELLALIRQLDPDCIVNQRVGNQLGDYAVREQKIPDKGEPQPWETCMTLNEAWGYHKNDENWKSTDSLIHSLLDIVSKGGNFLLNVGPTGEGLIPEPSVDRLKEVGKWLEINGEAVYGTTSSPLGEFAWGRCTKRVEKGNTTLYLFVFNRKEHKELSIPNLKNKVIECHLLASGKKVKIIPSNGGLIITLPSKNPEGNVEVIKIKVKGLIN